MRHSNTIQCLALFGVALSVYYYSLKAVKLRNICSLLDSVNITKQTMIDKSHARRFIIVTEPVHV